MPLLLTAGVKAVIYSNSCHSACCLWCYSNPPYLAGVFLDYRGKIGSGTLNYPGLYSSIHVNYPL